MGRVITVPFIVSLNGRNKSKFPVVSLAPHETWQALPVVGITLIMLQSKSPCKDHKGQNQRIERGVRPWAELRKTFVRSPVRAPLVGISRIKAFSILVTGSKPSQGSEINQ